MLHVWLMNAALHLVEYIGSQLVSPSLSLFVNSTLTHQMDLCRELWASCVSGKLVCRYLLIMVMFMRNIMGLWQSRTVIFKSLDSSGLLLPLFKNLLGSHS